MNFKELEVWKKSKAFTVQIYELTKEYPKEEQYEMVRNLRRAAAAASNNIAKGSNGNSDEEMIYYLGMARKNQAAIESTLEISLELGYLDDKAYKEIYEALDTCQRMTYGFMRYHKNKKNDDGEKDDSTIKVVKSPKKKEAAA